MAQYYVYLISSLPALRFNAKPPFSFDRFIKMCEGLVPQDELSILRNIRDEKHHAAVINQETFKKWAMFLITMKNGLVKVRASRKKLEPAKYLRPDGYADQEMTHVVMSAYKNTSILEAERVLDEAKWHKLDELLTGHFFDLDFLITYALKLLILERWDRINSADKSKLFKEIIATQEELKENA